MHLLSDTKFQIQAQFLEKGTKKYLVMAYCADERWVKPEYIWHTGPISQNAKPRVNHICYIKGGKPLVKPGVWRPDMWAKIFRVGRRKSNRYAGYYVKSHLTVSNK
jgi:hypothetical protein